MSVAGIKSYWLSDVTKIRNKLNSIWLEIERSDINPILKEKMREDINYMFKLLNKGQKKTTGIIIDGEFHNMNEVYGSTELHGIYHSFLRNHKHENIRNHHKKVEQR